MYREFAPDTPRPSSSARTCRLYARMVLICLSAALLLSCSSEKFMQPGQSVLASVKLTSPAKHLNARSYRNYVRQEPNSRWFTLFKVPLGIYCLSKADSIQGNKGVSKLWRKMGEAPVIYNRQLTLYGQNNLKHALEAEGYLHAEVDTLVTRNRHKTQVEYVLKPGMRYFINRLRFDFDSETVRRDFVADSTQTLLRQGMPLNLNTLSDERNRIIQALHNRGYYYLNKDFITYDIDTLKGSLGTDVTLRFAMPHGADSLRAYLPQRFRRVNIIEDDLEKSAALADSGEYRNLSFFYRGNPTLNRRVFVYHVSQRPDSLYSETGVQNTYGSLNALPAVSYTTLRMQPVEGSYDQLDCNITVRQNRRHTLGMELEGTNTSGDLGAAVALTYANRNLFHNSEQFSFKVRGAYEAITGLEGYSNQNYIEWSAEANLRFPTLLLPFVSINSKRTLKASSDAQLMYDMQDRPEFHRRVLTGTWSYRWSRTTSPNWQHRYDLISVNYVYMPWISDTFRKEYLEGEDPHYSVLRYSYENLFIMKTGYSFVYNSLRNAASLPAGLYQTNGYQIKLGVELAGNLLYGISSALRNKRTDNGSYRLFGIAYSQYAKIDFDFAKSVVLSENNSMAFHVAAGFGLPYGNSTILPYEKRYFAGGANSVRGWSVRGLGPGAYRGKDGKVDFINQTGNLKLDLSVEWRTYLFWKLHGAFFIDAGNIWNTRNYPDMNDALFRFRTFYKQIAVAYGLGLRFNFNYFILRLDGGMKAIDPATPGGRLHYPITQPNFGRDFALHFAVGLPF